MDRNRLIIDKLINIDENGMPEAPDIRQLLDDDVRKLYTRDSTKDKSMYIKECISSIKECISNIKCIRNCITRYISV